MQFEWPSVKYQKKLIRYDPFHEQLSQIAQPSRSRKIQPTLMAYFKNYKESGYAHNSSQITPLLRDLEIDSSSKRQTKSGSFKEIDWLSEPETKYEESMDEWECRSMSDLELTTAIEEYSQTIIELFSTRTSASSLKSNLRRSKNVRETDLDYDPILLSTSPIFSLRQQALINKNIFLIWLNHPNHKSKEEKKAEIDLSIETVVPEFMIHLFCKRYGLSRKNVLAHLKFEQSRFFR